MSGNELMVTKMMMLLKESLMNEVKDKEHEFKKTLKESKYLNAEDMDRINSIYDPILNQMESKLKNEFNKG